MMAPVTRLTKIEINWLGTHRCRHKHSYIEHYNCYITENPKNARFGFFDIEAYGYGNKRFCAQTSIMFCYCIKEMGKKKIHTGITTKQEILKMSDKKVMQQCIKDINKFDKVFTHNGTNYDLPFIRTRAIMNKLDFPEFGQICHRDVMYIARSKLSLRRYSQENVARVIKGKADKTHYSEEIWARVFQGNMKHMPGIVEHCKIDVRELEDNYRELAKYTKTYNRSI